MPEAHVYTSEFNGRPSYTVDHYEGTREVASYTMFTLDSLLRHLTQRGIKTTREELERICRASQKHSTTS